VAGERLGKHFFVALVDAVANGDAEFALEVGNRVGRDVVRPVVHVQARTPVESATGCSGYCEQKPAPVHGRLRSRSESRMRTPKKTPIRAEIALMAGLAPRRAVA